MVKRDKGSNSVNRQNPGHGFPSLGRYLLADALDDWRARASEMQVLAQPKSRIVQAAEGTGRQRS